MDAALETAEPTLGERAWLAQQRKLEIRIDDIRLDGADSRHDAVLQAAGNIVRKALLFCQNEFERLSAAQQKAVAGLEANVAEQRAAFDQRLVDLRDGLERQIAADIGAERDRREQLLADQAALISAQDKAIAQLRLEAAEHERALDQRLNAFWAELAKRTAEQVTAEREQRERVIAGQAELLEVRAGEIAALKTQLAEQERSFDRRLEDLQAEMERRFAGEIAEREAMQQEFGNVAA